MHPSALPAGRVLPAEFFAQPSPLVAEQLVGKIVWRAGVGGGRLVEVEAYLPAGDGACHAASGRTARNAPMFGPPGDLYVYLIYGVHHLLNIVCHAAGVASAVLIRAFEPLAPTHELARNRSACRRSSETEEELDPMDLASGPGLVTQALGIDGRWNRRSVGPDSGLHVLDDGYGPSVEATPRIGITRSQDLEMRFICPGSRYLSRSPRRGRPVGGNAYRGQEET